MEDKIISILREKLANEYHNYLDNDSEEARARLTSILELSHSIKSLSGIFGNEKYSDFFKYIDKVEKVLYKYIMWD